MAATILTSVQAGTILCTLDRVSGGSKSAQTVKVPPSQGPPAIWGVVGVFCVGQQEQEAAMLRQPRKYAHLASAELVLLLGVVACGETASRVR